MSISYGARAGKVCYVMRLKDRLVSLSFNKNDDDGLEAEIAASFRASFS